MFRARTLLAVLVAVLAGEGAATAGPMLTGSYQYDPATQLYTYSYVLDDRAAAGPVTNFYIRVLTDGFNNSLAPAGSTTPAPYQFGTFTGQGGIVGQMGFEGGTSFGWEPAGNWSAVETGVKTGFSFTTAHGPTDSGAANYYLWSTAVSNGPGGMQNAVQEMGRVPAPNFAHPADAPEPGTLALAGVGLGAVGLIRSRQRGACGPRA